MNFIEAVKLGSENGKKIKRDYWTCRYINFIDFGNELELVLSTAKELREKYTPTSTDIIADDWEIYKEKPKTVTFQEAFQALRNGKTIKRASEEIEFYQRSTSDITIYRQCPARSGSGLFLQESLDPEVALFSYEDIIATDWIISDDPIPIGLVT